MQGAFAGTSMFTCPGARFTGFSIKSSGTAQNGTFWHMSHVRHAFATCQPPLPEAGHVERDRDAARQPRTRGHPVPRDAPLGGLTCPKRAAPTRFRPAAPAGHDVESHAVVEDYTLPGAPSLSGSDGDGTPARSNCGTPASDAGSGVESATLTVDGPLHRTNTHACARLPTGGYTHRSVRERSRTASSP